MWMPGQIGTYLQERGTMHSVAVHWGELCIVAASSCRNSEDFCCNLIKTGLALKCRKDRHYM